MSAEALDPESVTPGIPPARIALYAHERDAEPEVVERAWAEIVVPLTSHEITMCQPCKGKACPSKKGFAFSPAPPTKACGCKDCVRTGRLLHRLDKNVEYVHLLVFDLDHVTWAELEAVCSRFEGFESVLYSTHNHLRGGLEDCCARLVLVPTRPMTPPEFYIVHSEVRRRYQLQWWRPGEQKISGADPVVKDISRLFYLPTAPEGGPEPLWGYSRGGLIDIDRLLAEAPGAVKNTVSSPPRASAPKPPSSSGPVDMEALREKLRAYRPTHSERDDGKVPRKELVRRVVAQEPLVKYEETNLRNDSVHRLGSILGHVLPLETPEEAVLELVRPSINALPVYPDDSEDDTLDKRFDVFCTAWKRGLEASESKRAAAEAKRQADRELQRKLRKKFHIKGEGESAPKETEEDEDGDEIPDEWEDALVKNKKDEAWAVGTNVELILDCHPDWRDKLSYNEFTKSPVFADDVPVSFGKDPEEAITAVQHWFQFDYRINLSRPDIMTVVRHCAKKSAFNPVKDYLNELAWDRQARLDGWLKRYCGARIIDEEGNNIELHVQRIGRRWLMSAVARALEPGCKADTVLILEGEQGKKKSMVLELLAGREFFTDSPVHIGQKDAMQVVGTKWIIEIAELSAFHGSETEAQKQFFSSRVDTFRPPFALTPQDFPRQSVCAGTTNKTNYLNDETGNRRFWAAWCDKVLIGDLKRDRDQLWAEAVYYFKESRGCAECKRLESSNEEARCIQHRWWLDPKENEELERANNQRLRVDYAEGILAHILEQAPDQRQQHLTMHEVCKFLNINAERIQSQSAAVSRALKSLKFTHRRVLQDGIRARVFETPMDLMIAPIRKKTRGLSLVKKPEQAQA
jgi:predicted P-loop ATPase